MIKGLPRGRLGALLSVCCETDDRGTFTGANLWYCDKCDVTFDIDEGEMSENGVFVYCPVGHRYRVSGRVLEFV